MWSCSHISDPYDSLFDRCVMSTLFIICLSQVYQRTARADAVTVNNAVNHLIIDY